MKEYMERTVEKALDEELIRQSVDIALSMKSPVATQVVIEGLLDFLVEKELRRCEYGKENRV